MRRFSGLFRRGLAAPIALLVVMAAGIPAAAEPNLHELEQREAEALEGAARAAERGDVLAALVSNLDAQRASVQKRVNALRSEMDRLDARIDRKKDQLEAAQMRMAVLTHELQGILSRLGARTDVFVERAVAAYKAGPTAYVEGVLSSETFNDVVSRYEYYQAALDADSALLDDIETLRQGVEMRREEVEEREAEISNAKLALQADRDAVRAIHDARAAVLAEKQTLVDQKQDLLATERNKESKLRAIAAAFDQAADELRSIAAGGSSGMPTGGGQLLWPAAGPMTSGYGYRTHPIFGDTRMHTGIDIGAPYGAPVIAADAGSVLFAGVMSGYGNAIVVDHGGGLSTTYNHLSAFVVSSGQSVGRGSQIGSVGCTGYCTGPHLHFEVRVNGSPVDPMPYLQ